MRYGSGSSWVTQNVTNAGNCTNAFFGTALGPWTVRFGPLVTLPDPYDPGDPLAAARFGEAVRDAVAELLETK